MSLKYLILGSSHMGVYLFNKLSPDARSGYFDGDEKEIKYCLTFSNILCYIIRNNTPLKHNKEEEEEMMMNAKTELTERAERAQVGYGELDGLLLRWSRKIHLDDLVSQKTLTKQDAEDLKQEVLINIFERLSEFDSNKANFETWAFLRCRQVMRSWVRMRIKESHPVLKQFRGRESIRGSIFRMDENFDVPVFDFYDDSDGLQSLVWGIERSIDRMDMRGDNREEAKKTLNLLADGKTIKEISDDMNVGASQVRAHVRRIRRATLTMCETEPVLV